MMKYFLNRLQMNGYDIPSPLSALQQAKNNCGYLLIYGSPMTSDL